MFNEREASSEGLVLGAGSGAGVGTRRGRGAATARGGLPPPGALARSDLCSPAVAGAGSRRYFEPYFSVFRAFAACLHYGGKKNCLRSDASGGRADVSEVP